MCDLQRSLELPESAVIFAILDHLDRIRFLDHLDKGHCSYLEELIETQISTIKETLPEVTAEQLFKIYKQTNNLNLYKLILEKADKNSKAFIELIGANKDIRPVDDLKELRQALENGD